MDEPTAVCGWCGDNIILTPTGKLRVHFLTEPKGPCRGSAEYPADTVTEAAAERLRDAAPALLKALQEAVAASYHRAECGWWDKRTETALWHDKGVCTCWIGRATEAIAAATVRPTA